MGLTSGDSAMSRDTFACQALGCGALLLASDRRPCPADCSAAPPPSHPAPDAGGAKAEKPWSQPGGKQRGQRLAEQNVGKFHGTNELASSDRRVPPGKEEQSAVSHQTDVAVPSGSVWTLPELVPARVLSRSCTEAMSETHTSVSLDITVTEKSHGKHEKTPGLIF